MLNETFCCDFQTLCISMINRIRSQSWIEYRQHDKQDWNCFSDLRPGHCILLQNFRRQSNCLFSKLRQSQHWDDHNTESISILSRFQWWDNFNAETLLYKSHAPFQKCIPKLNSNLWLVGPYRGQKNLKTLRFRLIDFCNL